MGVGNLLPIPLEFRAYSEGKSPWKAEKKRKFPVFSLLTGNRYRDWFAPDSEHHHSRSLVIIYIFSSAEAPGRPEALPLQGPPLPDKRRLWDAQRPSAAAARFFSQYFRCCCVKVVFWEMPFPRDILR